MRPIFKWGRRIVGALLAKGEYRPAVTKETTAGNEVIVEPEVVKPKGILRSKTVIAGLIAVFFAIANSQGWNLFFSEADANEVIAYITAGGGIAAVVSRILAWMPTRGPSGSG